MAKGKGRGQNPDKTTGQERAAEVRQNEKDKLDVPDLETPENPDEEDATPPKPVDDPDLPEEGDPEEFEEEEVPSEDFTEPQEAVERREEPNDLSGIEKEFDDNAPD
jgi:hypothetical protein